MKFGAYEILHELSQGGMGSVLLGRRRGPGSFEQLVAIKTIRSEYAGAEAVRAMFLDEAAILARLNHPAVATVHDFGEQAGTLYMVMEYVAGVSLRGMIGAMPPGVAARVIAEACRGLHAAHELRDLRGQPLGLVHRDISPDNIMLGFDGHIKVIDFGIALVKNRQAPVTEFGTVKGKPPYMSPEQVKNEAMDRRSDVFSLGVVLHELLTGAALFDGDSIYAVARAVEHQPIVPPSQVLGAELPLGLDGAVMAALDRDLARRTPTAAAFAEQLEQVITNAGDETLEAWAERELAAPRDAHRTWIAGIVAGTDAPRPIGRATSSVTALGSDALAVLAPSAQPDTGRREPPTHLPAATDDEDEVQPPRRTLLPLVLALLLLAAIGGGIAVVMRDAPRTSHDAGIVATIDAPSSDAPADPPVDAPAVIDEPDAALDPAPDAAGKTIARPRDAGTRPVVRDAGVAVQIDATVIAPPAGSGKLTAKHRPDGTYLNVVVDGKLFGTTPLFGRKLPAGAHVIELLEPDTNRVVARKQVTLDDGASVHIEP